MIGYSAAYLVSFLLAGQGYNVPSALVLIGAAVFLYVCEYRRTGQLLNMRGLLALGLIGGEGISCLKLSRLQGVWGAKTWLSFYLFYFVFWLVYGGVELWLGRAQGLNEQASLYRQQTLDKRKPLGAGAALLQAQNEKMQQDEQSSAAWRALPKTQQLCRFLGGAILVCLLLSFGAFFLEAAVLGYVPLLTKNTPHAYSYFHLSGVHYFTTLAVLIPSLAVLYGQRRGRMDFLCALGLVLPLVLTVLLVSRFQFLFAVILAVFTGMADGWKPKLRWLLPLFFAMVAVYIGITVARAHSIAYLNGIFEMKNPNTPIFITQPYMYIANNYDNFNCMTTQLKAHSFGLKMLFPLFALTGLKFLVPELLSFPSYTTKAELTTLTLLYDAYYDFGLAGVVLLAVFLACFCALAADRAARRSKPFAALFFAQFAFYLLFSFFTTWFSNPATWFYLAMTAVFACFYRHMEKSR